MKGGIDLALLRPDEDLGYLSQPWIDFTHLPDVNESHVHFPPHTTLLPDSRFYTYASFDKGKAYGMEIKADVPHLATAGLSAYLNYALGRVWFYNPVIAGFTTEAAHLTETSRFLAPMDQTHTLTSGVTYRNQRTRLWGAVGFEHATGPGLCATRCPSHFTQDLTIGWQAGADGSRPRLSLQFSVENLSNNVYLLSRESTMVQGQYSIPRLFSSAVKLGF